MLLMYSMYFIVATLLFQLLAKHSSAALPCTVLLNLNFTHTHMQKATACNIHSSAPE